MTIFSRQTQILDTVELGDQRVLSAALQPTWNRKREKFLSNNGIIQSELINLFGRGGMINKYGKYRFIAHVQALKHFCFAAEFSCDCVTVTYREFVVVLAAASCTQGAPLRTQHTSPAVNPPGCTRPAEGGARLIIFCC